MPFDLANPVWVMDQHLDIEHHIRHVIVPPPKMPRSSSGEQFGIAELASSGAAVNWLCQHRPKHRLNHQ